VAKETVMAKLASRGKAQVKQNNGTCSCGGELVWSRVHAPRARMMKLCEQCGSLYPRD